MIPEEGPEAPSHWREPLVPLDAEGCVGPRLWAIGLNALGLTRPLRLGLPGFEKAFVQWQ